MSARRLVRSGKNATASEKTAERIQNAARSLTYRIVVGIIGIAVGIAALVLAVVWFHKVYADPQHVFWDMVNNNLTTQGVTKEVSQNTGTVSTDELTQMVFVPQPMLRSVKQLSTSSGGTTTHLILEAVSTPKDNYQHYSLIERQAAPGQPKKDYAKVYALWLHNGGRGQSDGQATFNNAVFGALLFGNIPPEQRANIERSLHTAYHLDFAATKKQSQSHRRIYSYDAVISLKDYASAAHLYAKALGLPNADQINPANYDPDSKLAFTVTVDVLSRQVKQIAYKTSGITEAYSSYGVLTNITTPKHTVSYQELQNAINAVSK